MINSLKSKLCNFIGHWYKPFIEWEPKGDQVCRICGYLEKREYKKFEYDLNKMREIYTI